MSGDVNKILPSQNKSDHFERLEEEIIKEERRNQPIHISYSKQSSVAKILLIAQFASIFLTTAVTAALKFCRFTYLLAFIVFVFASLYFTVHYHYEDLAEITFLIREKYGIRI
jgi:hypothetical protein